MSLSAHRRTNELLWSHRCCELGRTPARASSFFEARTLLTGWVCSEGPAAGSGWVIIRQSPAGSCPLLFVSADGGPSTKLSKNGTLALDDVSWLESQQWNEAIDLMQRSIAIPKRRSMIGAGPSQGLELNVAR